MAWSGSYPKVVPWSTQVRDARPPRRDRRMKISFSFVAVLRPNLAHAQVQAKTPLSQVKAATWSSSTSSRFLQAGALVQGGGNLTAFFPPLLHIRSQWWTQGFPTDDLQLTAQPSGFSAGGQPRARRCSDVMELRSDVLTQDARRRIRKGTSAGSSHELPTSQPCRLRRNCWKHLEGVRKHFRLDIPDHVKLN